MANHSLVGTLFGVGYIDDCMILALNYMTNYTYSGNVTTDQRFMLQLTLRTLGGGASQPVCRDHPNRVYNGYRARAQESAAPDVTRKQKTIR